MENVLLVIALTFSISALFQSIISVNTQQQQIAMITPPNPERNQEDDIWLIAFLILLGATGLCYMIING